MNAFPVRVAAIVRSGLCIGCGLCEAITDGKVTMKMTARGSLRPTPLSKMTACEEQQIVAACPGIKVQARSWKQRHEDIIWGSFCDMRYAWAKDEDIRFKSATGGVLTALGVHLLRSGKVSFVLHVAACRENPLLNRWYIHETPEQVIAATGSRYAPTAPLAGLMIALRRQQPFAIIAKPCDLSAVHNLAAHDQNIDARCLFRLTMVCGGQSRLSKSRSLLAEAGVGEGQLRQIRYRGHGNPGKTHIESSDGRVFEKTYQEVWEDESGWEIENRCKICPDALGEAADVAAADVWPNAVPEGEDEGFNGIVVRSPAGITLVKEAVKAKDLVLGDSISAEQFNAFQPHQVSKKQRLNARLSALSQAQLPTINTRGLRLDRISKTMDKDAFTREYQATLQRIRSGRFGSEEEEAAQSH